MNQYLKIKVKETRKTYLRSSAHPEGRLISSETTISYRTVHRKIYRLAGLDTALSVHAAGGDSVYLATLKKGK